MASHPNENQEPSHTPLTGLAGLPAELQYMILGHLCPYCSIDSHADFPSSAAARALQHNLLSVAPNRALRAVAREHHDHSFVMRHDPDRARLLALAPGDFPPLPTFVQEVATAAHLRHQELPSLIERLLLNNNNNNLSAPRFLALRQIMTNLKSGMTRSRLRAFVRASEDRGVAIPEVVADVLAIDDQDDLYAGAVGESGAFVDLARCGFWVNGHGLVLGNALEALAFESWLARLLMHGLCSSSLERLLIEPALLLDWVMNANNNDKDVDAALPSVRALALTSFAPLQPDPSDRATDWAALLTARFPNLEALHLDADGALWRDDDDDNASTPPPCLLPGVTRLSIATGSAHILSDPTRVRDLLARACPALRELALFRQHDANGRWGAQPAMAEVFAPAARTLRTLTYSATTVTHTDDDGDEVEVAIGHRRMCETAVFQDLAVLEELRVDRALLGPLDMRVGSTLAGAGHGPHHPTLAERLPRALRALHVGFAYDWDEGLQAQVRALAAAKAAGRLPELRSVRVEVVEGDGGVCDCVVEPETRAALAGAGIGLEVRAYAVDAGGSARGLLPPAPGDEPFGRRAGRAVRVRVVHRRP